ncbi:MAG: hypothetical protein Q9201_005668, partial [Fulgogasparrea decipioides]
LCKEWLLKNTAPSATKTGAVGKYLVALSSSFATPTSTDETVKGKEPKHSSNRRQLRILYLLHDLLHHIKFHSADLADNAGSYRILEPYVSQLVALVSAYDATLYPQHFSKVNELLDLWATSEYFPSSYIAALQGTVTEAASVINSSTGNSEAVGDPRSTGGTGIGDGRSGAPFIMPPSHGDISDPFYDLPAGNLMPCIVPNSLTPIRPRMVQPLQFRAGPANEKLANAVKNFLQEADSIYGAKYPGTELHQLDIDELGQPIILKDPSEEVSDREGYYGWSRTFCEKMKMRNKGSRKVTSPRPHEAGSLRRRRTYSDSNASRSPSRSTSRSRSASASRKARRMRQASDSESNARNLCQSRRLDDDQEDRPRARFTSSRSRSRSMSYSPPDVAMPQHRPAGRETGSVPRPPHDGFLQAGHSPPAFLAQGFLGPYQLPVPPPPPPNYSGPWFGDKIPADVAR